MKSINRLLLIVFLLFGLHQIKAQSSPTAWEGKWVGVVEVWNYNKKINAFPMSLEISPQDTSWNFIVTYERDSNQPDARSYSLVEIDASIGHYAIDEHNSILLDSYLYDNCLYTSFAGLGSGLLTRMCLKDNQMEYEISSAQSDPIRVSGNAIVGKDTIPPVHSYSVYHVMKAVLDREH